MNVPTNTKEFSLEMAQQGHKLSTRDGRSAKFIAYVPDVIDSHKLVVQIGDEVNRYPVDGKIGMNHWDLFLAPLGYVEGKPVFAGDTLSYGSDTIKAAIDDNQQFLNGCKWPSKAPVVLSSMSYNDLAKHYFMFENENCNAKEWDSGSARNLTNKAIERSIADGDVIPTSLFVKLAKEAYNLRHKNDMSFSHNIGEVLREYLEGLK